MSNKRSAETIDKVNEFIASYLGGTLGHIQTEFHDGNVVKTLIYENRWYAWTVKNDFAIVMMSFNDLDYKFNSCVSFNLPDPEGEEEFYKKELEDVTFEEMVNFIKLCIEENKNKFIEE